MSRVIRVVLLSCDNGQVTDLHPNGAVGQALGLRHARRNGRNMVGLVVGGCGMDMGLHVIYTLGAALWPKGTPEPHGTRNGVLDSDGGYALKSEWL